MNRLWIALLCICILAGIESSTAHAAPTTAPAIAPEEALRLGLEQLAAGQNKEAFAFFDKGIAAAPPQHGKLDDETLTRLYEADALAYFRNSAAGKARQLMTRARNAAKQSRSIVLNAAVMDMSDKEGLSRAVDSMDKFCGANPTDEAALNVFGAALDKATGKYSETRLSTPKADYLRFNTQLENTKPGQRRWGSSWVSQGEYDHRKFDRDNKLKDQMDAQHRLEEAQLRLSNAQDDYARKVQENNRRPVNRRMPLDFQQRMVDNAQQHVKECQDKLDAATVAIPAIVWDYPTEGVDPDPVLAMK